MWETASGWRIFGSGSRRSLGAATRGVTLLICGGDGFPTVPGMAANTPLLAGGKGTGAIPTAVVQPGSGGLNAPIVARKIGQTFRRIVDPGSRRKTRLGDSGFLE